MGVWLRYKSWKPFYILVVSICHRNKPCWGQKGSRNEPEPYSSSHFQYEPIQSHMDPFQTKCSGCFGGIYLGVLDFWANIFGFFINARSPHLTTLKSD